MEDSEGNRKLAAASLPTTDAMADDVSDSEEEEDDEVCQDDEDDEEDLDYYYSFNEDASESDGVNGQLNNNLDPEFAQYECFTWAQAETFLQESVETACVALQIPVAEAKLYLHRNNWRLHGLKDALRLQPDASGTSQVSEKTSLPSSSSSMFCQVCASIQERRVFSALSCGHAFCRGCWEQHFDLQIRAGLATGLACMSAGCSAAAPESFVLTHVGPEGQARYSRLAFQELVRSHPMLRFCPGQNCRTVIKAEKTCAKKCVCSSCKLAFCFQCCSDYHAPTDCDTIRLWLTKCADDSETANYISAHTKDCPKCNICIEKNGGCNHMQCYNCKHDFCWMCLGDWKAHGSEYYECSRYKENPNIAHESAHAQAREALKKYLHYFERWENHSKSMKLEAQTLEKIKNRITQKVMEGSGTWIDWQYLFDASALLAKCRYTLQYTYPYAYYMEPSPRKELFEYQQAQLEAEIENLSWKIEHAESTDRGDLENQIDIAEKRRTSLLKDFLPS